MQDMRKLESKAGRAGSLNGKGRKERNVMKEGWKEETKNEARTEQMGEEEKAERKKKK